MLYLLRLCITLLAGFCLRAQGAPPVTVLTVDGAIGPASADYLVRGLGRAAAGSQLAVIVLDTPGGLDTSMRVIVKAILASPVPVAAFVAPGGARAASAGVFILYACHVAAMAPATNLGAATPVQLGAPAPPRQPVPATQPAQERSRPPSASDPGAASGGDPARKQLNDAAAYIRSLAQLRGRNADWAERAVREATSAPAHEALRLEVVDYLAADLPALLVQLDGKRLTAGGASRVLRTSGAPLHSYAPDWRVRLLSAITNPSIALLLLMAGVYGLLFEFMSPGGVLPGVAGAVCLLLALYALQLLPVNYAGLALIVVGLGFMAAEAFFPTYGILGLGGAVAFAAGALILVDTDLPGFGIPPALVIAVSLFGALLVGATASAALKARRLAVSGGAGGVLGATGEVLPPQAGQAWARVHGEQWQIACAQPLRPGQSVTVVGRRGLVLDVKPGPTIDEGGTP